MLVHQEDISHLSFFTVDFCGTFIHIHVYGTGTAPTLFAPPRGRSRRADARVQATQRPCRTSASHTTTSRRIQRNARSSAVAVLRPRCRRVGGRLPPGLCQPHMHGHAQRLACNETAGLHRLGATAIANGNAKASSSCQPSLVVPADRPCGCGPTLFKSGSWVCAPPSCRTAIQCGAPHRVNRACGRMPPWAPWPGPLSWDV
eukprot:350457-Chlamydomonas_euryale.AAC.1